MTQDDQGILVRGPLITFKGDITAVAGIDLEVTTGRVYGFLGPNGAGKSTTVHMLTTLLPPTAGRAPRGRLRRRHPMAPACDATSAPRCRRPRSTPSSPDREHMDLQAGLNGLSEVRARPAAAPRCSSASA